MPLTKPLNNNVLIEVIKDDSGVSRTDHSEALRRGTVISYSVSPYHLTASAAMKLDDMVGQLASLVGKVVRWEELAETGQTFEEDGKTYALVAWWRLISEEEA